VRNAQLSGRARAALDSAADVVIFDTDLNVIDFDDAEATLVNRYIERVGDGVAVRYMVDEPRQIL